MTTEAPTDYERAEKFLKLAFAAACQRNKLDEAQARALLSSLSDADIPTLHLPLPTVAPELWNARDQSLGETPPQFTRRVYGQWFGRGLERRTIRQLDHFLYARLYQWEERFPEACITELPSTEQLNDAIIGEMLLIYPLNTLRTVAANIATRLKKGTLRLP